MEKLSFGCCNSICTRVLLVADDKLQPARLKFSKCSDHVEFTRGPFFFCKTFAVVRKYPELFFFHQVLILRLM